MALVARVLAAAGIPCDVILPWWRRPGPGTLEGRALSEAGATASMRKPAHVPLLVTDQPRPVIASEKTICIDYELDKALGRQPGPDEVFHPILFHPDQISPATYQLAEELSGRGNRPLRLLFAGNCDKATYDTPRMGLQYGLLNRHELHALARALPEELAIFPQTGSELEALLAEARESGRPVEKLVWIDTQQFRIPGSGWFDLLSQADAFVCTPGVRYPWCQNLNEAMACGTIPLLQYPHLYNPALEPGVNCHLLGEAATFRTDIERVVANDPLETGRMSRSAVAYHRDQLSLERLVSAIRGFVEAPGEGTLTWYLAGKT